MTMASDEIPRIRRAPLPGTATLIVRGGVLSSTPLRQDALRFARRFSTWKKFGVSGFYAADAIEIDALTETKLHQFNTQVVFQRRQLENAGIQVVGTFRTPHVTLAHADLEHLLDGLMSCQQVECENPYYESGGQVGRNR